MLSLQALCNQNIATSIMSMPPQLQEFVVGESKDQIKNMIKDEAKTEARNEALKQVRKEMCDILPYMIPDIMQNIIHTMTNSGIYHQDYYKMYPNVPKEIVDLAVKSAEFTVNIMEERYVYRAFTPDTNYYNGYEDEEDEELDY